MVVLLTSILPSMTYAFKKSAKCKKSFLNLGRLTHTR